MNRKIKSILLFPFTILYKICPVFEQKLLFRIKCGYKLDLKNPKTYNEKLGWLKLFYRNNLIPVCADKYTARSYITEKGYGDHLPQLLWEGFDAKEIPWQSLPNSFVMKTTNGSGSVIICRDKTKLDLKSAKRKLSKWLKEKYLPAYGEWFYGIVKPRIIIEEFLDDGSGMVPKDYKMFYFNNVDGNCDAGLTRVDTGRFTNHTVNIYDQNWNFLPDAEMVYPICREYIVPKPACYEEMVACAKILGEPFPHVRVDFYVVGDKFYCGELTFLTGAGYDLVTPRSLNERMGEWIELPQILN